MKTGFQFDGEDNQKLKVNKLELEERALSTKCNS